MQYEKIANTWRIANEEHAQSGVVLIWKGEVYGWKNCLRDAQHGVSLEIENFCTLSALFNQSRFVTD